MHHVPVTISREEARTIWRKYREHRAWSQPIDRDCMRSYQLLAQGRLVIRALHSVATGGVSDKGLPKLAIARADARICHLSMYGNGGCRMAMSRSPRRSKTTMFEFPAGTFPGNAGWRNAEAIVPLAPLHLRPKRGLQNYHVLWEVEEWTKAPPDDPFLLRRIGKDGDLWCVCAMWNLTPVEKAALSTRL